MNLSHAGRSIGICVIISAVYMGFLAGEEIRAYELQSEPVAAVLSQVHSWSDGKDEYYQYDAVVTNSSDQIIEDWTLAIDVTADTEVSQFWNCSCSTEDGILTLKPADYAKHIEPGASTQGIGLIVISDDSEALDTYVLTVSYADETVAVRGSSSIQNFEEDSSIQNTEEDSSVQNSGEGKGIQNTEEGSSVQREQAALADVSNEGMGDMNIDAKVFKAKDRMPVPVLHVEGTSLKDEDGNSVRLQGISTHGLGVFPEYVSEESFRTLRDEFGANVMRLALYTQAENGYCDADQAGREAQDALIDKGVEACKALGMYVIIDWHILSDGNPLTHADEAEDFFRRMSERYADVPNVIYEICNEPNGSSWENEIVPYANRIIPVIRENSPDSVILVGTNTWSQDVHEACEAPLACDNIMYCLHFYAGTHKDDLRMRLASVLDRGIPVFISECSICDASGNGGVDYDSASAWKELITERGLSYIEWNLSNKDETSAIVLPSCSKLSGWSESDLSATGLWYRDMMRDLAG